MATNESLLCEDIQPREMATPLSVEFYLFLSFLVTLVIITPRMIMGSIMIVDVVVVISAVLFRKWMPCTRDMVHTTSISGSEHPYHKDRHSL
jgi:hypothetical protein